MRVAHTWSPETTAWDSRAMVRALACAGLRSRTRAAVAAFNTDASAARTRGPERA